MEPKYIMAIVAGGIFFVLFVAFLIVYFHNRRKKAEIRRRIEEMYADENLDKMEYDSAAYDEETKKIITGRAVADDSQLTIEELMTSPLPHEEKREFAKKITENIEEITGTYKADNGD